jgi:hypothetical protein
VPGLLFGLYMNNPKIPDQFNAISGLGTLLDYFPVRSWNRRGSLVISLLFLAGTVLVFLFGIYQAVLAARLHGPSMIDDKLAVPVGTALVLFVFGLLAGWNAFANWNKGAAVYDRGFAYRDRKGLQAWRWEEVTSLTSAITRHYTNGIYSGTSHRYTLFNHQNARLVLSDSIGKVELVAQAIDENIFPLLYGPAAGLYNTGQTLVFGPVAISKTGITIGKKTYPWLDVNEVSIRRGVLKVSRKEGGWLSGARAAASAIPNLRVLLAIVNQVVGVKAV